MTILYTDPFGPIWRFNWLRMILQWRGSLLQFFWVEWLFATAMCAIFLFIVCHFLPDETIEDVSESMQYLISSAYYVRSRFQAALSMMLAFYTTTLFDRWWRVRKLEGVAMGTIDDAAIQIAALISDSLPLETCEGGEKDEGVQGEGGGGDVDAGEFEEEASCTSASLSTDASARHPGKERYSGNKCTEECTRSDLIRITLVRWLNLSHAVAVGELYEKKPNEFCSLDRLVEYGMLKTGREYDCLSLEMTSRYVPPLVWALSLVRDIKERKECGVTDHTVVLFAGTITRIRGALDDLYMYRNTPVPLSYRQLVNVTVRTYAVFVGVLGAFTGFESSAINDRMQFSVSIFWTILPFWFSYFLFVGWLSLADALGNPFRQWADEFEWENYVGSAMTGSNLYVTESREGCMSATELKVDETGGKCKKCRISRADDIVKGLHEMYEGTSKE